MKLLNKIRNWWNPFGYERKVELRTWVFTPTENISAFELYKSNPPLWSYKVGYGEVNKLQIKIDEWYDNLSDNCKKYLTPSKHACTEYCNYEDV